MADHSPALQLYTLRTSLTTDLAGTLERAATIGFDNVELYRFEQYRDEYRTALAATGLHPISAHADLIRGDARGAIETALALGVGTLIEPRIDAARWTTRHDIADAAAELNGVARIARDHGVAIGYHNHDHEVTHEFDGKTGLEVFAEALDDDVVLEFDLFWAEVGGTSAVDLVAELGDRVRFLHVKDGPYSRALVDQVSAGEGEMPVEAVLKAAPEATRIVEFDDCAGDVFDAVARSLRYLAEVGR